MKANPFKIIEYVYPSGEKAFRVTGMLNGKQIRKNFGTEGEAVTAKQNFERELLNLAPVPMLNTRLTAAQATDAEWAFAELNGRPFRAAIQFYLNNYTDPTKTGTVADAVGKFIDAKSKENNRPDTIRNLKVRVGFLKTAYGEKPMGEIQPEQIKALIHREGRSSVTQDNDRRAMLSFFNWATLEGYCAKNPMATIAAIKTDREEPVILPLDRAKCLLKAAAQFKGGVCLPYVALGLFCAIRPTELARLSWDDIDLKARTVTIGAKIAKMRQRRIVEISKNAVAWLLTHADRKTPLRGKNWRKDFDKVKELVGYGTATADAPGLQPWTVDIMRHTGISYHLAFHQHEGQTATWAGNSPDMVQKHYKGLVKPKEAKAFWAVKP